METNIELKNLPLPGVETAEQYAAKELGLFNIVTWEGILNELGIIKPASQSAKIALERAIKRAGNSEIGESPSQLIERALAMLTPNAAPLDEARVLELIKANATYKGIEIKKGQETRKIEGIFHKDFDKCLKLVFSGCNLWLWGPAGSGKSHFAFQISEVLGMGYGCISLNNQTTKSDFLGYMDANGKYIGSEFRRIYENGGVFLLDEIDNGNPNIISLLNGGLEAHGMAFPDGFVKKHPDFRAIACANTFGTGASELYIGRNPIDAATQNRFIKIGIGYDLELERGLFGSEFCEPVWAARKKLEGQTGWVLSMRNIRTYKACIEAGFDKRESFNLAITTQLTEKLGCLL
jgi:hypothetical protein